MLSILHREAQEPTMSDAATLHPKPESDWSYPTGAYTGPYPYTYVGSYHYDPAATSHPTSQGSTKGYEPGGPANMTRGANYFFGFLVTFVVVLLLFVACGIGSRRRAAARRRRERDELLSGVPPYAQGTGAMTFRGLLAAGSAQAQRERQARNASNEELMKKKPTLHEVWLAPVDEKYHSYRDVQPNVGNGDSSGLQRKGTEAWFAIEPLSATMIRTPKDLQPYEHFNSNLASGSANTRNDSRMTTGMSPLLPQDATNRDVLPPYEAVDTRSPWYSRMLPAWTPRLGSRASVEGGLGAVGQRVSMITFPRPDLDVGSVRTAREKVQNRLLTRDEGAAQEADESAMQKNVEVAVMVVMPSEAIKRPPGLGTSSDNMGSAPIPECQIGVATVRMAEVA